jgi:hypothetical protein
MPWETPTEGKYRYHPGGNRNLEPKDAPSAINVVVVPDVSLPKVQCPPYLSCLEKRLPTIPETSFWII